MYFAVFLVWLVYLVSSPCTTEKNLQIMLIVIWVLHGWVKVGAGVSWCLYCSIFSAKRKTSAQKTFQRFLHIYMGGYCQWSHIKTLMFLHSDPTFPGRLISKVLQIKFRKISTIPPCWIWHGLSFITTKTQKYLDTIRCIYIV